MPSRTPRTKAEKQTAVGEVMGEFKRGKLRSGSKSGPVVKNPAQAKAIAMSEAGMERGPRGQERIDTVKGKAPPIGEGESKQNYDRSSHQKGNPGFAEGRHVPNQTYAAEQTEHWGEKASGTPTPPVPEATQPSGTSIGAGQTTSNIGPYGGKAHSFPCLQSERSCGFGHSGAQRQGHYRMSGHSGAHRLGKR